MKIIEFLGTPKAGKSKQLELVEKVLIHNKGYKTKTIQRGARRSSLNKNERFEYHSWSFHDVVNRIMELKKENFDYLLIDRGVYDHIAFTNTLYNEKEITKSQFESQKKYFNEFTFLEDACLVFLIDPNLAMKREFKYHKFRGKVMNKRFLTKLNSSYKELIPEIKKKKIIINGDDNLKKNLEYITNFICGSL